MAEGRANYRNKPTVGDRPRAPSPPALRGTAGRHDVQVHQQQDDNEDDDVDDGDDDDDDWDEIRFVS